jgi:HD-GYP domain-containing protein (c-di-GMP phosphodiesterase class II)
MPYTALTEVQHRIQVGAPLPFNVRAADGSLMLARQQILHSTEHVKALCERGALVDLDELLSPTDRVQKASPAELPALWRAHMDGLSQRLLNAKEPGFRAALEAESQPVLALVARDPDLAIFQVLSQSATPDRQYGLTHSLHAAIVARLVAERIGWRDNALETVFKAALTMNISMLDLQGQLAHRAEPLDDEQRRAVQVHPIASVHLLELAGVSNADWLTAVAQHHEQEDGMGYPSGTAIVHEMAQLIQRADRYTAKLSARGYRDSKTADQAGREMFMQAPGHPMNAALAKEMGVYPPGAFVRLASGEVGVVVKRGPRVNTPVVAVFQGADGKSLSQPVARQTLLPAHAVVGVIAAAAPPHIPPAPVLATLAASV